MSAVFGDVCPRLRVKCRMRRPPAHLLSTSCRHRSWLARCMMHRRSCSRLSRLSPDTNPHCMRLTQASAHTLQQALSSTQCAPSLDTQWGCRYRAAVQVRRRYDSCSCATSASVGTCRDMRCSCYIAGCFHRQVALSTVACGQAIAFRWAGLALGPKASFRRFG